MSKKELSDVKRNLGRLFLCLRQLSCWSNWLYKKTHVDSFLHIPKRFLWYRVIWSSSFDEVIDGDEKHIRWGQVKLKEVNSWVTCGWLIVNIYGKWKDVRKDILFFLLIYIDLFALCTRVSKDTSGLIVVRDEKNVPCNPELTQFWFIPYLYTLLNSDRSLWIFLWIKYILG